MNFPFHISLQHRCMVKLALQLYYDSDIEKMLDKALILPFNDCLGTDNCQLWFDHWKQIEKLAIEKLHVLPKLLSGRVVNLLLPMDQQVGYWRQKHIRANNGGDDVPLKGILRWKTNGTIDYDQTAKEIVQNKCINPKFRFFMACTYFMEEEISTFLDTNVEYFISPGVNSGTEFWIMYHKISGLPWTEWIKLWSSINNDWDRVSCFFRFLSLGDRVHYISSICYPNSEDFQCCLSQINEQERLQLFECDPHLLSSLLQWPLQVYFLDMANKLWSHMSVKHFESILRILLVECILKGLQDYNYLQLLREFWRRSPSFLKEEIQGCSIFQAIKMTLNYDSETETLPLEELLGKRFQFSGR